MSCLVVSCRGRPPAAPGRAAGRGLGMSEKSRSRLGIGLALLAAGRARADDPNRLFAIVIPPHRVNDQHDSSRDRAPNPLQPAFPSEWAGSSHSRPSGSPKTVAASSNGVPMFLEIDDGLPRIPREHFLYIQEFAALRHYLKLARWRTLGTGRRPTSFCPDRTLRARSRPLGARRPARSPADGVPWGIIRPRRPTSREPRGRTPWGSIC